MSQLPQPTYRATQLWLESVALFRTGVPLGKNRYRWKTADNCFIASEAVTWFHSELKGTFKTGISRGQTVHLLKKFYKSKIFIPVGKKEEEEEEGHGGQVANGSGSALAINNLNTNINENEFKDNGQLYKLTKWNVSEEYQKVKAIQSRNSNESNQSSAPTAQQQQQPLQNYTVVIKLLEQVEIYNIWKNVFIERFTSVHGGPEILEFLHPNLIHGDRIYYNMTKISQFGIVISSKPDDDLPPWLIHAMKCLANWPNPHILDPTTPSYPGFENDVFKLILDYFEPNKNSMPLLTPDLYDAFISTFIRAELFDFNCRLYGSKLENINTRRSSDEQYPLNYSDSLENLLIEILTPRNEKEGKLFDQKSQCSSSSSSQISIKPRRIFGNNNSNQPLHDTESPQLPAPMPQKSYSISRYNPTQLPSIIVSPPPPQAQIYYETAFTSIKTPITRIVSKTEMEQSNKFIMDQSNYAYENPVLQLSPTDLINHPKYDKVSKELNLGNQNYSYSFLNYSNSTAAPITSKKQSTIKPTTATTAQISRSHSASNLSDIDKDRSPYQPSHHQKMVRGFRTGGGMSTSMSLASGYANSPSKSARKTLDFYYGADACVPGLMTPSGKSHAILSFRLLTLLLPPQNRRHLQLLLRCMTKMVKNDKLRLDVGMSTRAIVINSFYRSILSPSNKSEFDELLALRIVTFLVDNDKEIFNIDIEKEIIKGKVDYIINEQQIIKIPIVDNNESKENSELLSSCQRITLDEYEEEKLLGSTSKSLRQLLDTIDTLHDQKLRKKKLRDFRSEYPHIYNDKFGDGNGSPAPAQAQAQAPGKRQSNREWKAFRLFKSLRL